MGGSPLSRKVERKSIRTSSACNKHLFFRQQAPISPFSIAQQINEGGKGERDSVNKSEINSRSALWSCRQVIKALLSSIFDLHQGFLILSNFSLCLDRWVGCTAAISTQPFSAGIVIGKLHSCICICAGFDHLCSQQSTQSSSKWHHLQRCRYLELQQDKLHQNPLENMLFWALLL